MPLPSEEVTPPVTNTNFGTAWTSGVFLILRRVDAERKARQDHKAGPIGIGMRRIRGNLHRILSPRVVEPSVEAQGPEERIAKLAVRLDRADHELPPGAAPPETVS